MRLFIAIPFPQDTKASLLAVQSRLRQVARSGNFSHPENLHLTLVFLGEVPDGRAPAITAAMEGVPARPFTLQFAGAGRFGDTWWAGIAESEPLNRLQHALAAALRAAGFAIESRSFQPHLTLARQVVLSPGVDSSAIGRFAPFHAEVRAIHLMKSERIQGRLTYTAIHERAL